MQIPIGISITKIELILKLAENREDNIKAFGEIRLYEHDSATPIFKIKGYTLRLKDFSGKQIISVSAPAFRSGSRFQTSFIFENKNLWSDLSKEFINEYEKLKTEDFDFDDKE